VQAYHRAHNNQAWPDNNLNNIQVVNMTLHLFGDLRGDHTLDHLDGSQRKPATDAKGWTYDFKRHTAVPVNCADAR
jgi:hypothetical protein